MSFEGQYLTYTEYQSLGGTLQETPFNLLEYEARKEIDINTQGRLVNETTIPEEVKLCVMNLISKINKYQVELNGNISSESVGDYSVSYNNDIKQIIKNKNAEITEQIITDLYGVIINGEHIIYRGA